MSEVQELTKTKEKPLWYVVFTYHNAEKRVEEHINSLAKTEKYDGLIIKAEVPVQKRTVSRRGKIKEIEEKIFPGYVFVKAVMTPEVMAAIRRINGVAHFVGGGNEPVPITPEEVKRARIQDDLSEEFKAGDTVMITDGPFENFIGKIIKIEGRKINIALSLFDREMGIDFSPEQIMKIQ
ncbi:transcriptional antiterminator NusG [Caldanaerobacter subterraneus subsp. tengcongensis MB4]|uniref:Transcription termination/antitermination protein NusG n=1 Tax=Caldanaerobacter subterraneus subsp. tengcongensis (strain DSM 15242 / JCM 11007 / NBRC 100824 / MB4) TaxID=273068 RepID=Q8R8A2_CALS4|nr:transcription termination/antitermination protein NusG [Caldanaerobacter subterraneus]AAM25279.1 Transcription antiterminator [Caldanaerobacter subterraneus subsp. tengcongensis MB4]MBE3578961.1 KOW motif-containing protein [Caldanaerobacter subterraneus]MCS3915122.1 transcriptional antiterminator NusG [Caldanaerobacter subterraneus subsp. tengcongensis MB4]